METRQRWITVIKVTARRLRWRRVLVLVLVMVFELQVLQVSHIAAGFWCQREKRVARFGFPRAEVSASSLRVPRREAPGRISVFQAAVAASLKGAPRGPRHASSVCLHRARAPTTTASCCSCRYGHHSQRQVTVCALGACRAGLDPSELLLAGHLAEKAAAERSVRRRDAGGVESRAST